MEGRAALVRSEAGYLTRYAGYQEVKPTCSTTSASTNTAATTRRSAISVRWSLSGEIRAVALNYLHTSSVTEQTLHGTSLTDLIGSIAVILLGRYRAHAWSTRRGGDQRRTPYSIRPIRLITSQKPLCSCSCSIGDLISKALAGDANQRDVWLELKAKSASAAFSTSVSDSPRLSQALESGGGVSLHCSCSWQRAPSQPSRSWMQPGAPHSSQTDPDSCSTRSTTAVTWSSPPWW